MISEKPEDRPDIATVLAELRVACFEYFCKRKDEDADDALKAIYELDDFKEKINHKDMAKGFTCLHWAKTHKRADVIEALTALGATD